jgi:hypothetical protein
VCLKKNVVSVQLTFCTPIVSIQMNADQHTPTAQVFMSAFKQLPSKERTAFVQALLSDTEFAEDLRDISIARERRNESDVSLDEYRKKRNLGTQNG